MGGYRHTLGITTGAFWIMAVIVCAIAAGLVLTGVIHLDPPRYDQGIMHYD